MDLKLFPTLLQPRLACASSPVQARKRHQGRWRQGLESQMRGNFQRPVPLKARRIHYSQVCAKLLKPLGGVVTFLPRDAAGSDRNIKADEAAHQQVALTF